MPVPGPILGPIGPPALPAVAQRVPVSALGGARPSKDSSAQAIRGALSIPAGQGFQGAVGLFCDYTTQKARLGPGASAAEKRAAAGHLIKLLRAVIADRQFPSSQLPSAYAAANQALFALGLTLPKPSTNYEAREAIYILGDRASPEQYKAALQGYLETKQPSSRAQKLVTLFEDMGPTVGGPLHQAGSQVASANGLLDDLRNRFWPNTTEQALSTILLLGEAPAYAQDVSNVAGRLALSAAQRGGAEVGRNIPAEELTKLAGRFPDGRIEPQIIRGVIPDLPRLLASTRGHSAAPPPIDFGGLVFGI